MMKKILATLLILTNAAFAANTGLNAFNAGELSPLLYGRSDIEKYYSGCRTLENMLVMSYGGATRRPGTAYIAAAKNASQKVRLIPFEYSTTDAYIIEAGNQYMRFYKDGARIQSGGLPYEIATTWLEADLLELQFIQSADVMFIVHPEYHPRQLSRTADTSWTIADVAFERGPFLEENETNQTVTPSATGGTITLTASSALFDSDHVGALWQIGYDLATTSINGSFTSAASSSSVTVQLGRSWSFNTGLVWTGTVQLQKSYDSGVTWGTVADKVYAGANNLNITTTGTETVDDAIYRVNMPTFNSGECKYSFAANGFQLNGVVRITGVNSATQAEASVIVPLGDTAATTFWAEGAWSAYRGYPSSAAFYEERLCFAGTTYQPQTVWFSETDDWTSFRNGTDNSDAMTFTIAADQVNAVRWMIPKESLILGTSGAEWTLSANSADEALTPTNVKAVRHSTYGSAVLQAIAVNNVVLFPQEQARKIRELAYSFEIDNYVAPDMTVLAEHITESGIVNMAYQSVPDSILWCVLADGDIAAMTYNREQDVVGWHRHVTDGDFESAAVIPGDTEDEIWVSVLRTVDGQSVRYIEQFQVRDYGTGADAYFVDSGVTMDGGDDRTIGGITQADPGVVTVLVWPTDGDATNMADGDYVLIDGVAGMTELNGMVFEVANANSVALTFSLKDRAGTDDYDTSALTAWTVGGTVQMVAQVVSGLSHLEGETVTVCGDGAADGTQVVDSGAITANDFYNTIHVGLPYTSTLSPMKLNVPLQSGTMMGQMVRIIDLTVRFHETLSCNAGPSSGTYDPITFRSVADALNAAVAPYSGDRTIAWRGGFDREGTIVLFTSDPLPMTILSLMPTFELGGR